jgi:hypothetical protein
MTHRFKYFLIVLFILLLVMMAISIYTLKPPSSPSQGFLRLVCHPIPKSVTEIRMDRRVRYLGGWHRYVFRFKIDEADLSPILNSWPFHEIRYFRYNPETGALEWANEEPPDYSESLHPPPWESSGMQFYNIRSGESEPEWCNIEQWDNPKVYLYIVRDVYRLRFLVYNNKLGEAYFIDLRSPD